MRNLTYLFNALITTTTISQQKATVIKTVKNRRSSISNRLICYDHFRMKYRGTFMESTPFCERDLESIWKFRIPTSILALSLSYIQPLPMSSWTAADFNLDSWHPHLPQTFGRDCEGIFSYNFLQLLRANKLILHWSFN
jgi:hypothetical protein